MKTKLILLFTYAIMQNIAAQTILKGHVVSEDGTPIPEANVYIPEQHKGTMTDAEGNFELLDLTQGTINVKVYAMGFTTKTQTVTITSKSTQVLNFTLAIDNTMEAVEVFGRRYKKPDKIEAITRLPLEPYKQIQSISVVGEKLIANQGALTISEVTKNVPGVYTFATYGNKRESMSSRGFRGIPILKNGVRVHSDFRGVGILTDMQGVDNIQVLKGAASVTQGVATDLGSPGGVINIVTKTPLYNFGGIAAVRLGSNGQVRPTFDVYGPVNEKKNVAFRINGALERADSYRSHISSERFYINPSFQWRVDNKTKITLEMDYFDDSRTPDLGTVNLATNDINAIYNLPHHQFLGYTNDRAITQNTTYTLRFDRKLSEKLSLKGAFYKSHLKLNDKGASLGSPVVVNNQTIYHMRNRGYSVSSRKDNNSVLQFDVIGDDFFTGKVKHTFQVGFDYRASKYSTKSQSQSNLDVVNVYGNNTHTLPALSLENERLGGGETRAIGFVAQDVVTWTNWLQTFLGLRYSSTETIGNTENTRSNAFNPLGGIIVSPTKNINLFASYTNSSYPRNAARLGANGETLGNERYDQLETGVKTSWMDDRLRFNLTLFKINNRDINLPVYDATWTTIVHYAKGGNDQRQGIEVELTGRPLTNLELIAGYSYIDAQYKNHTSYVYGSAPLNTPKHTANLYLNYMFEGALQGFSLGTGMYYTGKRPINDWSSGAVTHEGIVPNQKPFDVEAFTQINAQAAYTFNSHWSARVLVNNLFNNIGYNAYRTRYINQTDPRNFAAVIMYSF